MKDLNCMNVTRERARVVTLASCLWALGAAQAGEGEALAGANGAADVEAPRASVETTASTGLRTNGNTGVAVPSGIVDVDNNAPSSVSGEEVGVPPGELAVSAEELAVDVASASEVATTAAETVAASAVEAAIDAAVQDEIAAAVEASVLGDVQSAVENDLVTEVTDSLPLP
jgi:hypothetical protein